MGGMCHSSGLSGGDQTTQTDCERAHLHGICGPEKGLQYGAPRGRRTLRNYPYLGSEAQAKQFCQHVTNWVSINEMSVGIAKCGLMEFLPKETVITPLVPGQVVDGLFLEGLPLPIVDRYMYLGILMTPDLTVESMVNHRVLQGRATVASVLPYLRCPVLPMSMRLVTVAVVVGPRLLFGAELYGMNRKLTDKMQVLMNRSLRACIGARRSGNVPSVGLWKEARTLPICALAGARRARAYAKAMGLKTWLREMVLQPLRSRNWTWCSGVPRWIVRFALPHAPPDIRAAYLGAGWQVLDPAALVEVVKACIMARECKLRRKQLDTFDGSPNIVV